MNLIFRPLCAVLKVAIYVNLSETEHFEFYYVDLTGNEHSKKDSTFYGPQKLKLVK